MLVGLSVHGEWKMYVPHITFGVLNVDAIVMPGATVLDKIEKVKKLMK